MAYSQDWSSLRKYVRDSFTIARCLFLLDAACLLFSLRLPGAEKVFKAARHHAKGLLRLPGIEQHKL